MHDSSDVGGVDDNVDENGDEIPNVGAAKADVGIAGDRFGVTGNGS